MEGGNGFRKRNNIRQRILNARGLYFLLSFGFIYVFIFNYIPMYGILMAFKRYSPRLGIWGSEWIGFYQFGRLFTSENFWLILRNTVVLSFYCLIAGFPLPVILALCVNHCMFRKFTKTVQTITFAPYFLSAVVIVGLITQLFALRTGGINLFLQSLGLKQINFMGSAAAFPHIYAWSNTWKGFGYSAIIYISSLASVDPAYHEAAVIDGASLWQRIWHIDLTTIRPIIVIMLILWMGSVLANDFEKIYLLQTPQNLYTSEVINTYVYKVGIDGQGGRADYSFGTAIGLFQNGVGIVLTLLVNKIANKISGEGMF
jgi:ABC-type polysaccharide transport system permease subunit